METVVVFPAPFGPEQSDHLARPRLEGNVVHGDQVAIALVQSSNFQHGRSRMS